MAMSPEEWHADIELNDQTVRTYLEGQFPALLPINSLQEIGEGWDNSIFLVNKKIIFRFPRRQAAIALMERESILLNNLPDFSGINTPRLKYLGRPTATNPYPCQGYEIIEGCSGYQANLSEQDRHNNIVILAKF